MIMSQIEKRTHSSRVVCRSVVSSFFTGVFSDPGDICHGMDDVMATEELAPHDAPGASALAASAGPRSNHSRYTLHSLTETSHCPDTE